MIRYLAAFMVLFFGALALVALLPTPPEAALHGAATTVRSASRSESDRTRSGVRVVYPAVIDGQTSTAIASDVVPPASIPVDHSPTQSQPALAVSGTAPVVQGAQQATATLNLNTASVEDLNGLPGAGRIGRTIASHRPYRSVDELLAKRVVRRDVYDRIKNQLAAD